MRYSLGRIDIDTHRERGRRVGKVYASSIVEEQ